MSTIQKYAPKMNTVMITTTVVFCTSLRLGVVTFYNDVRTEMKKVTTPTRKEVQATTAVVIVTVFLFGVYFFVIDFVIQHSVDKFFRFFAHR